MTDDRLTEIRAFAVRNPSFRVREDGLIWDARNDDYVVLKQVLELLNQSRDIGDVKFRKSILKINEMLRNTWIVQRLDNPQIEVSPHHKKKTPYVHTLRVMSAGVSDGLQDRGVVFLLRIAELFHDFGKIFGAVKEGGAIHQFLSVELIRDLIEQSDLFTKDQIDLLFKTIYRHHLYDRIRYNQGENIESAKQIFKSDEEFQLFLMLVFADMMSIVSLTKDISYVATAFVQLMKIKPRFPRDLLPDEMREFISRNST